MRRLQEAPSVFITGASGSIGSAAAESFAHLGWDVAVGYGSRERKAEAVAKKVRATGMEAITVGGDITVEADRQRIIEQVIEWAPELGALVLNAAGGMEKERADDPDYPMAINRDANVALVEGLLPILEGDVVFVQSYAGSLHGQIAMPSEEYGQKVAGPKQAGEQALREMMPRLKDRYEMNRLLVVSGGVVEGTAVGRHFMSDEEAVDQQRRIHNIVPKSEMGWRIAAAVMNPFHESGHVEIVGAPHEVLLGGAQK